MRNSAGKEFYSNGFQLGLDFSGVGKAKATPAKRLPEANARPPSFSPERPLTGIIRLLLFFRDHGWTLHTSDFYQSRLYGSYRQRMSDCRKRGIVVMTSTTVVNDQKHSTFYIPEQYRDRAREIMGGMK